MIRGTISRKWSLALGFASLALLAAGYTALSIAQHAKNPSDTTIPSWTQLADGVCRAVEVNKRSGERWIAVDAEASCSRFLMGLALGGFMAVVLGLAMGCLAPFEAFMQPPLSFLAQIPPTAALAVFFVIVGTGQEMYVAMIAFGILPAMAQTVYLAVKEFPEELQFKSYTLGASHSEVVLVVILRQILPKILDALRLSVGPALVYLIAAEMVVGDVGFGYRIRLQSKLLNMSVVYPYLAVLAAFGFAMCFSLVWLRRWTCPWAEREGR